MDSTIVCRTGVSASEILSQSPLLVDGRHSSLPAALIAQARSPVSPRSPEERRGAAGQPLVEPQVHQHLAQKHARGETDADADLIAIRAEALSRGGGHPVPRSDERSVLPAGR